MLLAIPLVAQPSRTLDDDRARVAEISGHATKPVVRRGWWHTTGEADLLAVWNSDIPEGGNDGALWAGRGLNVVAAAGITGGYEGTRYALRVALQPAVSYSANRPFDIRPGITPGRSVYSSPFHGGAASLDLPIRFGDRRLQRVDAGQSRVEMRAWNAVIGATSAGQWWGPGIRNALVMSDNAPGIPRLYLRNDRPMRTRAGVFNAELQLGTLTTSLYFDSLAASAYRSFSGLTMSYRTPFDTGLTLGVSRGVYAPSAGRYPPLRALWHSLAWEPRVGASDRRKADQVSSLWGRWVFANAGLEVYGELARQTMPSSFGEMFQTPEKSGGYTVGAQWLTGRGASDRTVRVQVELSNLEQSALDGAVTPADLYAGRTAPQGYTQRGQLLGARIGPGGSSNWVAVDYLARRWQMGVFVERIRWEEDALLRQRYASTFAHDVGVAGGIRGAVRLTSVDLSAELSVMRRMNYLLQNGFGTLGDRGTVNVRNLSFTTRLTRR